MRRCGGRLFASKSRILTSELTTPSNQTAPVLTNTTTVGTSAGRLQHRGVVLIVVLVLVMMVALAGFGFLSAMSTEYEAARLNGSMLQARQTLASAESVLRWISGLSDRERRMLGGLHSNPALFRGRVVEPLTAAGGRGDSPTSLSSQPDASRLSPSQDLSADSAAGMGQTDDRWRYSVVSLDSSLEQNRVLRFGLRNESEKIHLASVLRWEQASPGMGRNALMQLPGMTESVADAILDWLDADEQTREFGAESEYYQTLDRPYLARNAVPQSLTELLYVKGMTRQLLTGAATQENSGTGLSDSMQPQSPTIDAKGDLVASSNSAGLGWDQLLTVFSAERNRSRSGQQRVSLNNGSLTVLEQELALVLPENVVRYILLARVYGITLTSGDGVEPSAAPFAITMVPAFRLQSLADLMDSTVQVPTATGTIVVSSPLQSESPDFSQVARRLLDLTSTQPEQLIQGRVNLTEASEVVLRMLPGMTPEISTQLITQRSSLDAGEDGSVLWLLSRNVLEIDVFRQVFPEITTGGDVFEGEIVVHRAVGGPMVRRKIILDGASTPVRRVHWTDLTDVPLPFSPQLLMPAAL